MAVSHTTREPRPGEVYGESYYYISRDEFARLIGADAFIEHAEFNGNLYGTSKQTVLDQAAKGSIVVLDIEMEGVKQLKSTMSTQGNVNYRFIFVRPPNFATLESRLRGRGTEDETSVQRRLTQARNEITCSETPGVHDKIIVNNDLDAAYKELDDFVFRKAERGGKDA
ncbi:hypothetical protein SEUCBS140593_009580 [Sporothrix eucalyptigena]|uniref:Guanylate kinase-like domain-containing protein n=1 Tax=Sporothrix eucalyptigena TaxID=1812306 RepID=A0ABP0CW81_9PEZI